MIAEKTLAAIDAAIFKDQGSAYRKFLRELMPQAEDAYRESGDDFRSHLGASLIGRPCDRELWLTFHWAKKRPIEARVLRLFNRGHLEEPRMVAALMAIGCQVWQHDASGEQYRITGVGGHYGSAIDGVVKGIPEMPDIAILTEFKTHGDKSFKKLQGEGVRKAKFEHYVQMNQYMGEYNLPYALYLATNKNDDDLYAEIIKFDPDNYQQFKARARTIVLTKEIPARINNSPSWYQCRFCDFKSLCHGADTVERNCRTCFHSHTHEDGTWRCIKPMQPIGEGQDKILTKQDQLAGCEDYKEIPNIRVK